MPEREETDDAQLIAAAKAGSRQAFDRLVSRHAPRLLVLANRMLASEADAEDAVQNAMASAWLALGRFDLSRNVAPWLTTITINKCRDHLRRQRLKSLLRIDSADAVQVLADDAPGPEQEAIDRQLLAEVRKQIARLPIRLKEPFVLVALDGWSQAEAAELLAISEKAVETRIYRARKRLREKARYSEG